MSLLSVGNEFIQCGSGRMHIFGSKHCKLFITAKNMGVPLCLHSYIRLLTNNIYYRNVFTDPDTLALLPEDGHLCSMTLEWPRIAILYNPSLPSFQNLSLGLSLNSSLSHAQRLCCKSAKVMLLTQVIFTTRKKSQ